MSANKDNGRDFDAGSAIGRLGMDRGHWSQTVILMLMAGSMIASATYFNVSQVWNVASQDQAAMSSMDRRVTTLEAEHTADEATMQRLVTLIDQERAAEDDLALSIRSLQAVIEHSGRR